MIACYCRWALTVDGVTVSKLTPTASCTSLLFPRAHKGYASFRISATSHHIHARLGSTPEWSTSSNAHSPVSCRLCRGAAVSTALHPPPTACNGPFCSHLPPRSCRACTAETLRCA